MLNSENATAWLESFIVAEGGASGTVHQRQGGRLKLLAQVNIPLQVQTVIELIPKGKGMAGLAWERNAPVSTCNLQTDRSGDVRPGAKAVGAQAAVALPIGGEPDEGPSFVVGIAYLGERVLNDRQLELLATRAAALLQL